MSKFPFLLLILAILTSLSFSLPDAWGFFAHRRINRLAVFTLPPQMTGFYKKHIEYITEHATDPDKRRYASKHEAVRHYIDVDHWGISDVPRQWTDALLKYADVYVINNQQDTMQILGDSIAERRQGTLLIQDEKAQTILGQDTINYAAYRELFKAKILPQYYEDEWVLEPREFSFLLTNPRQLATIEKIIFVDRFSEYGILPYHLDKMLRKLTRAFTERNLNKILRYSAEIGHYVGDAHVPLHTTENYNGQLTNQIGIHAFWESRLPELFADDSYDYFVGKAEIILEPSPYFWNIIDESHSYLDSVLLIEKDLSKTFPPDQQYCYEERGGRTIRIQCTDYSRAYHERLDGQVESRLRKAIRTVGDVWYTAWVQAGQPDLSHFGELSLTEEERRERKEVDKAFESGKIKGRKH